jgi:hypothetical protein
MSRTRHHFSDTYAEAREAFLSEVARASGQLVSTINPHAAGPAGEALATDIAWFGPTDAKRVMVSISGTHGQEFFAGAATQLAWLRGDGPSSLPIDVAVCLVHAHNAYGAAHLSRTNENNVDLNRNWFDHTAPRAANTRYGELDAILFQDALDESIIDEAVTGFFAWAESRTREELFEALDNGQQSHPEGIIYCGVEAQWATTNLLAYTQAHLRHAQRVAVIDWHTGLGAFGQPLVMADMEPASDEARWAAAWWGARLSAEKAATPFVGQDGGYIKIGLAEAMRAQGASVASAVIEWGTYDTAAIMKALIIDRWLRFRCGDPKGVTAAIWRTRMMELLNPSAPEWRKAVVDKGVEIYHDTICGLDLWR